jgi:hypothetical protein
MIKYSLLYGLPETRLHIAIHGFAFLKFAKPADEHNLQTFPTLLQASIQVNMRRTLAHDLLHLTRPVGVKSLSRYLQHLTLTG